MLNVVAGLQIDPLGRRIEKAKPGVAVAADGIDVIVLLQLHDIAQGVKALQPAFHHVTDQNQNVIVGEVKLQQQTLQIGEIAVDIRNRQNAAALWKGHSVYSCFFHCQSNLTMLSEPGDYMRFSMVSTGVSTP